MLSLSLNQSGHFWRTNLPSIKATESLGYMFGCHLTGGEVITLRGELGTGKTVLVRGLASGVEIDSHLVTSPTFTLIHEYHGRIHLIHADLYRIETPQELASIGFDEYLNSSSAAVVIEWAERMGDNPPDDRLDIHLEHQHQSVRKATLRVTGPRSQNLILQTLNHCSS